MGETVGSNTGENLSLPAIENQGAIRYIDAVKVRDVIKMIESDGWYLVVTKGSHRQYKHPKKSGRVTIAGHPSHDLAPGTLNSIVKQAQLKEIK